MNIGAVIGLFIALLYVTYAYYSDKRMVTRLNADPVVAALRGRVTYHISRGKIIIICMFGSTGGAIVGWLVS